MVDLITDGESKGFDRHTMDDVGVPSLALIEGAATHLYSECEKLIGKDESILIAAGCGNNGADALALARILRLNGYDRIKVFLQKGRESEERRKEREIAISLGIEESGLNDADVVIDGLYGVGLKGEVREEGKKLISEMNALKRRIAISIDVPSGVGYSSSFSDCVNADYTITLGKAKASLYSPMTRMHAGVIIVRNPSIDYGDVESSIQLFSSEDVTLPKIESSAYKNKRGHLAIFAGSKGYTGAARLSAYASFSSGAGLVTVFTHPDIVDAMRSESYSAIIKSVDDEFDANKYGAILFGPGFGKGQGEQEKLAEVLGTAECPVVIDADGIHDFVALGGGEHKCKTLVLTPHLGELKTLACGSVWNSVEEFHETLLGLSGKYSATIVAKSDVTTVAMDGRIYVYDGSNPSLGVAGSGDVLSGMMATLLMQGASPLAAVSFHQMAGRKARREHGFFDAVRVCEAAGSLR